MFFTKLPRGSLIFAFLSLPTFKKYLEIWVKDMFDCKDKLLEIREDFHPERFPSRKIFIQKDFHPERFSSTKISIHKDFHPQRFPFTTISIHKDFHPQRFPSTKISTHKDFYPQRFPSRKISIHKDFHPQRFPSTKISIHKDFHPERFPSRKISIQKHHKLPVTELLKQGLSAEIKNTLLNMFIQKKSVSFCYINSLESVLSVLGWT